MTRWAHHYHVAKASNAPTREQRLAWKKAHKRDDQGEEAQDAPVIFVIEDFRAQGQEEGPSPIEQIVGDTKRRILDESGFLEQMHQAATRQELEAFFGEKERKRAILSTLFHKYSPDKALEWKTKLTQGELENARAMLQHLFSARVKPEKDAGLHKALEEERAREQTTKKPSNWQALRERIALLGNVHYNDLAAFMACPVVREHGGYRSPLETLRALSDPQKRLSLLQELANLRHALTFQGAHRLHERREALHHLKEFLGYYEKPEYELLTENERIALLGSYARVEACAAALDEYAEGLEGKEETREIPDRSLYAAKASAIGRFFEEDRQSSNRSLGSKHGQPGLIRRLENAAKQMRAAVPAPRSPKGEVGNVFDILADGLKQGGWIAELHVPESLKYTCTLIALEEIGYVYLQIAAGRMEKLEPKSLQERVKTLVLEALRRGVRGPKESDMVPFNTSMLDPRREFDALRVTIESKPEPSSEEVNELLLLLEWLTYRGEAPADITRKDIQRLRTKVRAEAKELRKHVERAREALPLVADSGAIRSHLLDFITQTGKRDIVRKVLKEERFALWMRYQAYVSGKAKADNKDIERLREHSSTMCTFIDERLTEEEKIEVAKALIRTLGRDAEALRAMLGGALEERRLYEEARDALQKIVSGAVADGDSAKIAQRAARDPETLRAALDHAYLEERRRILGDLALPEKERERRLAVLDQAYEDEKRVRLELHLTRIAEWESIIRAALEAEIRMQARELQEEYVKNLADGRVKRISKGMNKNEQEMLWDAFLVESEIMRILALREREELQSDPGVVMTVEGDLAQLTDCRRVARDPLAEAAVILNDAKDCQRDAAKLLASPAFKDAPESVRQNIELYASGAILPGPGAAKKVKVLAENPALAARAAKEHERIENTATEISTVTFEVAKLEKELTNVQEEVQKALKLYQPKGEYGYTELSMGLPIVLEDKHYAVIRGKLHAASKIPSTPEAKRLLAEAENELKRLRAFAVTLKKFAAQEPEVLDEEAFRAFAGRELPPDAWSGLDQREERIVLRKKILEQNPKTKAAMLAEERAHALNIAVVKHLNPRFFVDIYNTISGENSAQIQRLFRQWAEKRFGKAPDFTSEEYRQWRHEVADEFMAKLSLFHRYGARLPLSPADIQLFQELHRSHAKILPTTEGTAWYPRLRKVAASPGQRDPLSPQVLHVGADQGPTGVREVSGGQGEAEEQAARDEGQEEREGPPPQNGYVEGSRIVEYLIDAKRILVKAKSYLDTYADRDPFAADNKDYITELEAEYRAIEKDIRKKDSEKDESLQGRAITLAENLHTVEKKISEFDFQREDLRQVPPVGKGLLQIWRSIEWLSISDVMRIFKDIAEDIKRQYNRRQEGKIGRVGEMITAWISPKIPYLGNLHHDFHERRQRAEIEEVEHFKKGLANVDAFEIQFMTHHTSNKDFLKACIIELTDRGRMNWNDTEMWKTFNKLSRFKMPIEECQRNDNLKEAWLRKIISDIWEDKDNYRNWKRKNDESFAGKMKEYTTEADRLSNLKGGLAGELEKQLRIYVEVTEEMKKTGKRFPLDETIRRDLYMECIDYSIRNGKMSMEEKLYYLVQGVATGLLSTDRLRILAGEGGGILNIFPFIDYFYGRNNTMPELQTLAERLLEAPKGEITNPLRFRPGLKTTLWLELEVAREPRVQERLRKGIDRRSGDMDHDDFHFFMPRLDYKTIDAMATPKGGGLQKVTGDGWRNGYIGYNSFFKSRGIVAKLEQEGVAKFTTSDAYEVIKAVSGFVRMDGILTKRSGYGDTEGRRPGITWSEMKNSRAVWSKDSTVYDDRKKVDTFVREVLEAYMDRRITRKFIEDATRSTEGGVTPTEQQKKDSYEASDRLEQYLERAIKEQGTAKLKNILTQHMETFNNTGSAENLNYENAKKLWLETEKQRSGTTQAISRRAA